MYTILRLATDTICTHVISLTLQKGQDATAYTYVGETVEYAVSILPVDHPTVLWCRCVSRSRAHARSFRTVLAPPLSLSSAFSLALALALARALSFTLPVCLSLPLPAQTHTCLPSVLHTPMHARTHARTHACTHARTHTHTYARTRAHTMQRRGM